MRRTNEIYYKDYIQQLDTAGITPADEIEDILEEVKDRQGDFYPEFRKWLGIVLENLETRNPIKQGRKAIDFESYLINTVCMPALYSAGIESEFPVKMTDNKDGTFSAYREFPAEVVEELRLLHWCYLELETVMTRITEAKQDENRGNA